jgi:hypothetical protein
MTREDIIAMAQEADLLLFAEFWPDDFKGLMGCAERFAALVAAAERNKVAQWMMAQGYATGHGDTTEDLLRELEWQVREAERKAILQMSAATWFKTQADYDAAIRAMGQS